MDPNKKKHKPEIEQPIPSKIYPVIDNDLARDNVKNDIPAADLNDITMGGQYG